MLSSKVSLFAGTSVARTPQGYLDAAGWPHASSSELLASLDGCARHNDSAQPSSQHAKVPVVSHVLATVASEFNKKPFHWLVEVRRG